MRPELTDAKPDLFRVRAGRDGEETGIKWACSADCSNRAVSGRTYRPMSLGGAGTFIASRDPQTLADWGDLTMIDIWVVTSLPAPVSCWNRLVAIAAQTRADSRSLWEAAMTKALVQCWPILSRAKIG